MTIETHADIITALGGGTKLSRGLEALGRTVDRETVYAWKLRNRIPADYWPDIVEVARRASVTEITLELLANLNAKARRPVAAAAEQAA
jgi:hypothetical protein